MKIFLKKYKGVLFLISLTLFSMLLLTSCSEIGLLSEKNSWLVQDINSVGDFIKVYLVLQLSIFLVSLLIGFFLGRLGDIISLVIHFIWIVSARDYGFFKVLLLFGVFSIVSFLISLLRGGRQRNY